VNVPVAVSSATAATTIQQGRNFTLLLLSKNYRRALCVVPARLAQQPAGRL
jgi:hypothetical protein